MNALSFLCSVILCSSFFLQLLDTKSTDRKITLLHYIAETVEEKFPDIEKFHTDLQYVEKAANSKISNQNLLAA